MHDHAYPIPYSRQIFRQQRLTKINDACVHIFPSRDFEGPVPVVDPHLSLILGHLFLDGDPYVDL